MLKILILAPMLMLTASATAFEIKLDATWIPKLGQLCTVARYGSLMTAEPICNELAVAVQKAQQEEAAAKAVVEEEKNASGAKQKGAP